MTDFIVLLRGINVGGHKKVPMAELRALAGELGFGDVRTYIQSGNLLFSSDFSSEVVEADLEAALQRRFGFPVDAVVRTVEQWRVYAAGSAFPEAAAERPHLVMLGLSRRPPHPDAEGRLQAAAAAGERVVCRGDAVWFDFAGGSARSKLTPALLERAAGSPVTTRNWRTVLKLAELAQGG